MKKKTIRIVGIVAVVVCIAVSALAVLRVRYISVGNSERIFLYTPLEKNSIGGSAQKMCIRDRYSEKCAILRLSRLLAACREGVRMSLGPTG